MLCEHPPLKGEAPLYKASGDVAGSSLFLSYCIAVDIKRLLSLRPVNSEFCPI